MIFTEEHVSTLWPIWKMLSILNSHTHSIEVTDDLDHNRTQNKRSLLLYLEKLLDDLQQAWAADTSDKYNKSC